MNDGVLLEARALGRQVDGRWLWRGLSFELVAGERLAIVGPTGSGKSLLLRGLAGLDRLDEGGVALLGRPMSAWSPPESRAVICYLPQRAAVTEGTVAENLQRVFAFRVHRDRSWSRERALGLVEALGRGADFLEKPAAELSGGEAQLLALVRALQLEPRILMLDEATASLDPATVGRVEALVARWIEEPGRGCLWVTHDPRQVERVASRRLQLGASS